MPRPCLAEIDHWGYYNGKPYLIPHLKVSIYGTNIIIDDDEQRVANEELCKIGMLRKVLYPTGGESLFYYGLHYWNYMVYRGYSTQEEVCDNFPGQPFPRKVGGARINKIEDIDMNGNAVNVREFIYNKGILLGYPNYLKEILPIRPDAIFAHFYTCIMGRNTYPNEKYIQYAEVTEKNSNSGSTTFRFTSYLDIDNRDQFNITPSTYCKILIDSYKEWPPLLGFRGDSRSYRRGLLTEKIQYDNNSNIVSGDEIQYAIQHTSEPKYIRTLYMENFLTNKYKIENYAYLPVKIKHYDICNGTSVIATRQMEYNDKYLIKKETEIEKLMTTEYKYPCDLMEIAPYSEMVTKNILNPVLERRVSKSGVMLREETNDYLAKSYNDNVLYLPSAVYSRNRNESQKTLDTRFDVYDSYGNVIAATGKDNVDKVYIWGYKGKYPVAEIGNATYSQVKSALNNVGPESMSLLDPPDISTLDRLRDNNNLKDSYITTYTYKPLVGMLAKTTSDKNTIYYGYDRFNRLNSNRDNSNRLISSNVYNLLYTIPINVKINANGAYSFGNTVSFLADVEGGTGDFLYDWSVRNTRDQNVVAQLLNTSSRSFDVKLTQEGTMSLTCRVKDNKSEQIVEENILFTVSAPPQIIFTNITTSDNPPYTKIMTAELNCEETVNLKFSIGISASSGSANYRIGPSSYQISSGGGSQSVNVTLPKGKNTVELRLYKPSSGSSSAWIVIDAVNSGNSTIGIDRTLRLNM